MHLSKEAATESCVIAFRIMLLLRLPFIFESMCQGALGAAVALLVEGTKDENYFSIISHCAPTAASVQPFMSVLLKIAHLWPATGFLSTVLPFIPLFICQ